MFASLALDLSGLLGVPQRSVTVAIILGAAAVLGAILAIIRRPRPTAVAPRRHLDGPRAAAWIILGVAAGAVLPVQAAVNANLRRDLNAPITVAMISFVVATVVITIVLLVLLATRRTQVPQFRALATMPWWGWLGGACAAAYVTATFLLIPRIGAATTVALTVTGQQLFSAVIDSRGLFRMSRRPLTRSRLSGLALLIVGCALVQLG
jgi:bacterial/archaeal transporter family-2 protein